MYVCWHKNVALVCDMEAIVGCIGITGGMYCNNDVIIEVFRHSEGIIMR